MRRDPGVARNARARKQRPREFGALGYHGNQPPSALVAASWLAECLNEKAPPEAGRRLIWLRL
jgi:hypothetical protein